MNQTRENDQKKLTSDPILAKIWVPKHFFFLGWGGADPDPLGPISQKHFPRGKTSTIS